MDKTLSVACLVLGLGLASPVIAEEASPTEIQISPAYSIARGGRLYDNWFKENESAKPESTHKSYPATGQYADKAAATWRCKECHGWDYRGAEGAYAEGAHATGIKGIRAAEGKSTDAIIAILRDATHGYSETLLNAADTQDLANFVSRGQIDMARFIGPDSKATGDAEAGREYYQTVCANCHGLDGKDGEEELGKLARKNPWETVHKIRYGQPGKEMPALHVFGDDVTAAILAYLQKALP